MNFIREEMIIFISEIQFTLYQILKSLKSEMIQNYGIQLIYKRISFLYQHLCDNQCIEFNLFFNKNN